jgi:glycosyltransferase involved in cell wall biosynthesis
MGNGVPVIASNVGGLSEIITEETGWLVHDYLTTDGFKRAIREIMAGKQCLARKSTKSREFVAKRHSWEAFLQEARIFYLDRFEANTHSRKRSANELPNPLSSHWHEVH